MVALKVLVSGLMLFTLLGVAAPAWAQPPAAPSTQISPKQASVISLPRTTGPIITDNAVNIPVKTWSLQITPALSFVGGDFTRYWQRGSVGADQPTRKQAAAVAGDYLLMQVPMELYYSLTPRLEVSAMIPFVQNWASNVGPASQAANFGSLGDSSLTFRYMFLNGKATSPTLTGYFSVLFPTGHASPLEPKLLGIDQTGGGAFAFTWGIDFFTYFPKGPILFYANVWYTNYADGWVNRARVYYPDQVTVNLAFEVPLKKSPNNRWAFLLEVLSTWDAGRMFGPKANQPSVAIISVLPALEFMPTSWFNVALGVQVDLFGKNTQYTYTPTLACFFNF